MPPNTRFEMGDSHEITDVWTGQAASFDLYTEGEHQFIAFYAADQSLAAGQRLLGETDWTLATVTEQRNDVWDDHNNLTLAVDDDGYIHLVGDLHVHPLNYFRTTEPLDVTTFERVDSMVGSEEDRTTYPRFFRGPDGALIFEYRHGKSGAGNWIYNEWDPDSGSWERLLDEPLLGGGEAVSAYKNGPVVGPDGYYHLAWGWRDHPAAQQQHDIYYARSEDLREWETSRGDSLSLPIYEGAGELVDPVPPWGGNLNGVNGIGFDGSDRVILTYRKFDQDGNTQIYNARAEEAAVDGLSPEGWELYQTSDWAYRDAFGGWGSLGTVLSVDRVRIDPDGRLSQSYTHPKYGSGRWILDEETLQPVEWRNPWHQYPEDVATPRSDHPRMKVMWGEDSGEAPEGEQFVLRWEANATKDSHTDRDAPRTSTLELYQVK